MYPILTICKASAGSGKTFTLTKEFLKIVLKEPSQYHRILAITFTNKATAEMKSRILESLERLSKGVMKGMGEVLLEEMRDYDAARLQYAAQEALGYMLHDYSRLSVMTIDSFFQKIIQAFIYELKLPSGVALQMETDRVLEQAVEEVISAYSNEDNDLNQWLRAFAFSKLEADKNWKLADDIRKLAGELLKENVSSLNIDYSFEVIGDLSEKLKRQEESYNEDIKLLAEKAWQAIVRHGLEEDKFTRNSIPNTLRKMKNDPGSYFSESVQKVIESGDSPFTKSKVKGAEMERALQAWEEDILPACREIASYHREHSWDVNTGKAVSKNLYSLALLSAVNQQIKQYREKESAMLISDNTTFIHEVTKETHTSFLYEKAGIFYKNILLDEFQDTSTLQWKNIMPLLEEILSSQKGKILIVGDAKQSIYRWRNGNMQLILNGVKEDLASFWNELAEDTVLKGNYRSLPEVVKFNNRVFPALAQNAQENAGLKYGLMRLNSFERIYPEASTRQEAMRKSAQNGYVEYAFLTKEMLEAQEQDLRLQMTADKIRELTTQYGYRKKDITILVRRHADAVEVAQFLTTLEDKIPVLSAEALLYSRQKHIQLLLEAMRFLIHADASLYYVGMLYRYAQLHGLKTDESTIFEDWNVYNIRSSKENLATRTDSLLYQWLPFLRDEEKEKLFSYNLSQLLRTLIKGLNLQDKQDIYLQQFQDIVFKFQGNNPGAGIANFLEWWDERSEKLAVNMPEGPDAVQIITIHKSKGLEFPVVIIPYADWSMVESNKGQILWVETQGSPFEDVGTLPVLFNDCKETHFHEHYLTEVSMQMADALNMTYVAFTRAAEQLYVFSEIQEDEKKRTLKDASKIGHLIYQTLKAQSEGRWENLTYSCGEKHIKVGELKSTHSKTLETSVPEFTLEESTGMKPMVNDTDERLMGNFIHDVLAQLTDISNLDDVIKKVSVQSKVKPSIVAAAKERLNSCLQDEQLRNWFSGEYESVSEHDIWWKGEAIRPDKILLKGEQAILLDFKTGKPEKKHEAQIKVYQEAIAGLGISLSASYLVYISELGQVECRGV